MSPANDTTCLPIVYDDPLCFQSSYRPFYFSDKLQLIEGTPDEHLTIAAPVIAYWVLSLLFHFLDTRTWKWLDKYRIHPSEEVKSRNIVSRKEVIYAVIFQQIIQTWLAWVWLSNQSHDIVDHAVAIQHIALKLQSFAAFLGVSDPVFIVQGAGLVYWWAIPLLQLFAAMFIIDTWQYFLHRFMHVNKFFYRHFHSWHHRLTVPYAFGALYNHPVEGFLLDSLGAAVAEACTFMNTRQAMFLFALSCFKTVDDHCGYSFPWDPLQMITANNADYHDIHHQAIGIKSNFAQPFFVHWDAVLGTRMTRQDIEERRRAQRNKTK